jgi:hypothetical protein
MGGAMFGSAVVDLVIGMLFVFLVFSLVVSGINEAITRLLVSRSRQLWRAMKELLDGGAGSGDQRPPKDAVAGEDSPLSLKLYTHPVIHQLETAVRDKHSRLSHIPSTEFARGLVGVLVPEGENATTVQQIRNRIQELPDSLKKPLLPIASEAGEQVDKLRRGIGEWFDTKMSALATVYRRKTKWVMFVLGLIVAVTLNVDAIGAAQQLYRDQVLRTAVAQQAVDVATDCQSEQGADVEECTRNAVGNLDGSVRLPAGWTGKTLSDVDGWQILGWLIAAVALGQGAPLWFNLLRRVGSVRR